MGEAIDKLRQFKFSVHADTDEY